MVAGRRDSRGDRPRRGDHRLRDAVRRGTRQSATRRDTAALVAAPRPEPHRVRWAARGGCGTAAMTRAAPVSMPPTGSSASPALRPLTDPATGR